jgi:branched-chain amino acid transport system substrate-binding protein
MNSSKNEIPILLGSLVVTGGVLAAGYFWYKSTTDKPAPVAVNTSNTTNSNNGASNPANNTNSSSTAGNTTSGTLSAGDKNLGGSEGKNSGNFLQAKNAGISAMSSKNYSLATTEFDKALKITPNAPETHIYANNAKIGDKKSLSIGVAIPWKSNEPGALEVLRGVAQAQTEINNAGGVDGSPIKVVLVDDAGEKETVNQAAAAFGKDQQILGVVGHFSSDTTAAAVQVYKDSKLVSIAPVSTSIELTGITPYSFRTVPSDYIAARALSEYALKNIKKTKAVVFFNSKSSYSKSLKSEFSQSMGASGGAIVQEIDMAADDFNANTALAQANTAEAEFIMLAANNSALEKPLQVIDNNNKKLPILAGDGLYSPKVLEGGKDKAVGMTVAVPWHIDGDPKAKFATSSRQFWKADVNWRTALAYDAVQAFAVAMKTPNPTRETIQKALSNPTFQATGSSGSIKFLPSHDRNATIQLVKIAPGNKSRTGFDFVPVKK